MAVVKHAFMPFYIIIQFWNDFQVQGSAIFQAGATWTADDNIYDARDATNAADLSGVDTMSWWCDAGGGGVAGIAFVGALCTSYNTNLNEKQWSAAGSGFVSWNEIMNSFDSDQNRFVDPYVNGSHFIFKYRFSLMSLDTTLEWAMTLMINMEGMMGPAMGKVSWVTDHMIITNGQHAQNQIGKSIMHLWTGETDVLRIYQVKLFHEV